MFKHLQELQSDYLRVITVARTVWPEPGHLASQIEFLSRCAAENGLSVIDSLSLDGISDWEMGQHMRRLICRKKRRDDFDGVLLTDRHRLCGRTGSLRILQGFKRAGVEVITLMDNTIGWGPLVYSVTRVHEMSEQEVGHE
jgi:hypothetical protein